MIVLHQDFPCIKVECDCTKEVLEHGTCMDCDKGYTYQKLTQNVEEARELLESLTIFKHRGHFGKSDVCPACRKYDIAQARLKEIEEENLKEKQ